MSTVFSLDFRRRLWLGLLLQGVSLGGVVQIVRTVAGRACCPQRAVGGCQKRHGSDLCERSQRAEDSTPCLRRVQPSALCGLSRTLPGKTDAPNTLAPPLARACCKRDASVLLACCLGILMVFSWCSHRVLIVFSSCSLGISFVFSSCFPLARPSGSRQPSGVSTPLLSQFDRHCQSACAPIS